MRGRFLIFINLPWILLSILNHFFLHTEHQDFIRLLMWYYQFTLLGVLMFPTISTLLPKLPDKGYAISRITSLLVLFFINWLGTSIGLMTFTAPALSFCLLLLIILSHLIPHQEEDLFELMREHSSYIWKAEFLYLFIFSLLLVIQSLHPEIYWGEKPMDYTLLNFNLRNTTLPMQDPWFSGRPMHYYYLGYYIYAGMAKMSGVGGELGYALSIVTSASLFAVSLFGLLVFLTKRAMTSLWGVLLILLAGNFKSFYAIIFEHQKTDFKYFWSTARVFKNEVFAEYPSWSFLFADLHPHVMSYAFSSLYLLLMIYSVEHLWRKNLSRETLFGGVLLSLSYGALLGINGWDFLIYTLFSCLYFAFSLRREKVGQSISLHALFHSLALLLFLPMLLTLNGGKKVKWGYFPLQLNSLTEHFSLHGHWWVMIFCMVFPVLFLHRKGVRWNALFRSIGFRFTVVAILIACCAELFFFNDRINTIFKVFTNVYIWGGIATVISFRFFKFYLSRKHLIPFALVCVLVTNIVLVGSYFNFEGVTDERFFDSVSTGLRGGQYMRQFGLRDYKIISWINDNIEGTPTVVERYSRSFDPKAARISMHTGLPTYLGWDGHVYLRGAPYRDIEKRKREIDYIFNGKDPIAMVDFLSRRNISLIVVGDFERSYYSKEGLEKFSKNSDMFKLLYKSGESALYGVGNYQRFLNK